MDNVEKKKPMVLHSVWTWLPVTMNWLYSQIRGISKIDVSVISRDVTNLEMFPVRKYSYVKSKWLRKLYTYLYHLGLRVIPREYAYFLEEKKIRIMHSHFGDRAWYDMSLARRLKVPQFVSFYGLDVEYIPNRRRVWKKRYSELFDFVEKVLVLGPVMKNKLIELGCPEEKICIHHVGINVESIEFRKRHYDKDNDVLKVLIAASFREKKGIPYALKALSKLKNNINMHITIIGDTDGSKRSNKEKVKIQEAIHECGLENMLTHLGYQPYSRIIEESYKNHIFINPSVASSDGDSEGTPVVLMDMMATGIPVISTYHSDIPEIIKDGVNGWLAQEKDIEGLNKKILMCLSEYDKKSEMTHAARQRIEMEFNNKIQSEKLEKLYSAYL